MRFWKLAHLGELFGRKLQFAIVFCTFCTLIYYYFFFKYNSVFVLFFCMHKYIYNKYVITRLLFLKSTWIWILWHHRACCAGTRYCDVCLIILHWYNIYWIIEFLVFTVQCSYASVVLGIVILFVWLSVCQSVRPSHACLVTKVKNIKLKFIHLMKG